MVDPIEAKFGALIASLQPSARTKLAKIIASALRKSQSSRIAAQRNPDDSAFEPRKPRLRSSKKRLRAMFGKLRTNAYLKSSGNADEAIISFSQDVQRIARVHQLGLRDRVNKHGLQVQYPVRELLGITTEEEKTLQHIISEHISEHL